MLKEWCVLMAVACGTFMATLDSSIVNIALPSLVQEFVRPLSAVKWVTSIYLLVITCALLPLGRLSDRFGRKRVFQLGFLVFTFGSFLCGLMSSLVALVMFRAFQALGGAMMMTNGPAIVTLTFKPFQRGRALGVLGMVVSAGLVSGPSVGGFIVQSLGWPSIFWINIPFGILGFLLVEKFVYFPCRIHSDPLIWEALDWKGAILQAACIFGLSFLLERLAMGAFGFKEIGFCILLFLGVQWFYKVERSALVPLLDFELFASRRFCLANGAGFCMAMAYSCVSLLTPFYLQQILKMNLTQAGLWMSLIPLTTFVISPWSGLLSDRYVPQYISLMGAILGFLTLCVWVLDLYLQPQWGLKLLTLELMGVGLAMSLFQSPNNNSILSSVLPEKLGIASATLSLIRNLGFALGATLSSSLLMFSGSSKTSSPQSIILVLGVAASIFAVAVWMLCQNWETQKHALAP